MGGAAAILTVCRYLSGRQSDMIFSVVFLAGASVFFFTRRGSAAQLQRNWETKGSWIPPGWFFDLFVLGGVLVFIALAVASSMGTLN